MRLWIPLCLLNAILGRKSFNVVTFKGGKAIGKSKFGVPVRYAAQQSIDTTPVATGSSLNICRGFSPDQEDRCVSFLFAKKRRAADAFQIALNCSPGQFLCENHINSVKAGGRSLHHREVWKVS